VAPQAVGAPSAIATDSRKMSGSGRNAKCEARGQLFHARRKLELWFKKLGNPRDADIDQHPEDRLPEDISRTKPNELGHDACRRTCRATNVHPGQGEPRRLAQSSAVAEL
jgi:hypothetical protein